MKIVFPENMYDSFGELKNGDVFRLNGKVFMKTTSSIPTVNTVNLEDGKLSITYDLTEVEKLNGEYIIK